jgi:hypothetical protein
MSKVDLVTERQQVVFGNDSVVIVKHGADLAGGRALDVDGITELVLEAGRVIVTDGNGVYKPLPITATTDKSGATTYAYNALPDGYAYAGILCGSILTAKPAASILIAGVVNEAALLVPFGDQATAIKAALPNIVFVKDEVA